MIKKPLSDPAGCTGDIRAMLDTLDILGGKWKLLILHYLMTREGERNTFKKMEKDIVGISAKMLTQELKILEAHKLVNRTTLPTKPISVNYSITDYGKQTKPVIDALLTWGHNHRITLFSNHIH